MDFFLVSDAPEAMSIVEDVYLEMLDDKCFTRKHQEKRRRHIMVLLLNLFRASLIHPKRYVSVPLTRTLYSIKSRYYAEYTSHDILTGLISALEDDVRAYISVEKGFKDRVTNKGFVTRIRATQSLISKFQEYGLTARMISRSPDAEIIVLKDEEKKVVDYVDTTSTISMRARLSDINGMLRETFIGLHVSDSKLRTINGPVTADEDVLDFSATTLHRVFNNSSFELGGRLFGGWWQSVPSNLRKHIEVAYRHSIVPKFAVEVDFSSMQPSLAYARARIAPPPDSYRPSGIKREDQDRFRPILKAAMLRMLNARSRIQAVESLGGYLNALPTAEQPVDAETAISLLEDLHTPISAYFYSGIGIELMFEESELALDIIEAMLNQGAVALPIHDSFLVMRGWREDLGETMRRVFTRRTGQSCAVSFDETILEFEHRESGQSVISAPPMEEILEREMADREDCSVFWSRFDDWLNSRSWYTPEPVGDEPPPPYDGW